MRTIAAKPKKKKSGDGTGEKKNAVCGDVKVDVGVGEENIDMYVKNVTKKVSSWRMVFFYFFVAGD